MKPGILLQLEQVSVKPGTQTVLHSIDLTIHEREHWAVTGASGSGKTVLAQIPACVTRHLYLEKGKATIIQ